MTIVRISSVVDGWNICDGEHDDVPFQLRNVGMVPLINIVHNKNDLKKVEVVKKWQSNEIIHKEEINRPCSLMTLCHRLSPRVEVSSACGCTEKVREKRKSHMGPSNFFCALDLFDLRARGHSRTFEANSCLDQPQGCPSHQTEGAKNRLRNSNCMC